MTSLKALAALAAALRDAGVTEYVGEVPDACIGTVTLKLAPLPRAEAPAPEPKKPEGPEERWAAVEKRLFPDG